MEEEIAVTAAAAPVHEYTVWGLIMAADPVVKGVMILLVLMSVACWAITFEKMAKVFWLNRGIRNLAKAREGKVSGGLARDVVEAGQRELEADLDDTDTERRYRVENAMRFSLKSQIQQLEGGLPFLATIGSAAPFIGLFGTVWGIVNSFTAIATQKDTSLAVVAPGIAEALIATAMGLAAAIPAVMAYNQVTVALGRAFARGNSAVIDIARHLAGDGTRPQVDPRRAGATNVAPLRAGKPS